MYCIFIFTELNSASDGVIRELWVIVILLSAVVSTLGRPSINVSTLS